MKKTNMKNFLTLLIAMLSLLPTAMHGAGKKVVTSIDITIPLPKDGMGIEDGEQIQITAAKTAYGTWFSKASRRSSAFYGKASSTEKIPILPSSRQAIRIVPA